MFGDYAFLCAAYGLTGANGNSQFLKTIGHLTYFSEC